eukprot:g6218.t1
MGNQGSFMEKIYVYLPVLMCHSKMDYEDKRTVWNIRAAYFSEQVAVFALSAYFIFAIRRRKNERKILVPDISQGQMFANHIPGPDELTYRETTYFKHEMTQVFQQLQQNFVALLFTILAHFVLGFRPILLLQIFSTPYHFAENRLFRKFVLGLKPGYRVWGERFESEVEQGRIRKELEGEGKEEGPAVAAAAAAQDVVVGGGGEGGGEGALAPPAGAGEVSEASEAEGKPAAATVVVVDAPQTESENLPMPRELEDKLIDAWEAAGKGDWGAVMEQLGPFSVNTQTPVGRWSPLMVACGLSQVGTEDIKTLVEDLDAQPDLRDQDGWTCLHWAAQQGRAAAAAAVLEALASLASEPGAAADMVRDLRDIRDNDGKTAADVAREAGLESAVLEAFLGVLRVEEKGGDGSS